MHQHGLQTLHELAAHLKLGPALVEELCVTLRKETLVEVRRRGELDGDVHLRADAGRPRARRRCAGAQPVQRRRRRCRSAPTPQRVRAQSVAGMGVTAGRAARARSPTW